MRDRTAGLSAAAQHAREFLGGLDERPVAARVDAAGVRDALGGPLPEHGEASDVVIDALAAGAEPGLVATAGPRHFGFVIGGALPAALAADWLVSAWDQNAAFHSLSPAAAAIEEITAAWALDLFGLPETASVGFVTGGQGANTTCLAAARHAVLAKAGWNVEDDGLIGAPPVRILCGEQAHATIDTALRQLGSAQRRRSASKPTTRAGCDPTRFATRCRMPTGPDDRLRAGGKRRHRRLRRVRTDRRRLHRARRLAARRRRIRTVGRRRTRVRAPDEAASSAPTRGQSTPTSG